MKITADVLGLKELDKQLAKVAGATKGKVLRAALRKAAKPVHEEMQSGFNQGFNTQTGRIDDSIKTKTALNKKGQHSIYDAAAYVGVYPNKKAQALTGSKPHILNPKGLNNLMHPGFEGQPFVRPALINNESKVISTTKSELAKGIERAIKRQSK